MKEEYKKSALKVIDGISQPPSVNPEIMKHPEKRRRKSFTLDEYIDGIRSGNMTILSRAITLAESSLPEHYELSQSIIEKCLSFNTQSVRIGITGVPGVGKSTFIESLGNHLVNSGRKLAVLAIDPSSGQTGGSILGDKTRMEKLSNNPNAFIRPSPSAGSLGGVARKTRETIILCEAAGFDTIIVETVGVGQSETAVHSMVDFFLLLMLAGAGDELQGIKRGIMEMADAIAITKADGQNTLAAESARVSYQIALSLFPPSRSGWKPAVVTCSARQNTGITDLWSIINDYFNESKRTGYFDILRQQQAVIRMNDTIMEYLRNSFMNHEEILKLRPELEKQLHSGTITSYKAAQTLLDKYFKK